MTDIMKLADDYIAQLLSDVGRQYGFRRVTATTDGKARAALQSAIEALQAENERLNDDCAMHMRVAVKAIDEVVELKAERDALQAKLDALEKQEPVQFLAKGARFKTSEFPYGVCINGLPKELAGRWVALVAAEDDCHLKLAAPKALEPLTDAMRKDIAMQCAKLDWDDDYTASVGKVIALAEAAHGITKGTP